MNLKFFGAWLGLASLFCALPATAQTTGLDLARASNCLSCHQVDGRRVGPSFTLVARRFAGQAGAVDYLASTIRSGGRGRWGAVPMPAQPQVSPEQAKAIAEWILTLDQAPAPKP
ncbi:c-type cytochrome [Paralcaligenes ginsengisoli]